MDEMEGWERIITEWQRVKRMKKLNQELYDLLGGAVMHILDYAKKNNIVLPNRESIYDSAERIHALMDEINKDQKQIPAFDKDSKGSDSK